MYHLIILLSRFQMIPNAYIIWFYLIASRIPPGQVSRKRWVRCCVLVSALRVFRFCVVSPCPGARKRKEDEANNRREEKPEVLKTSFPKEAKTAPKMRPRGSILAPLWVPNSLPDASEALLGANWARGGSPGGSQNAPRGPRGRKNFIVI